MTTEPIRSKQKIDAIYQELRNHEVPVLAHRNYLLFKLGINSILRISDIITLKVGQVFNGKGAREYLALQEKKTGKNKKIKLNVTIIDEIRVFADLYGLEKDDYIFFSVRNPQNHIDRTLAWRIIKRAAVKVGVENCATHTMRKTFAYFVYKKTKDVALVQTLLNHSSPRETMRYIGINQDNMDRAYEEIVL